MVGFFLEVIREDLRSDEELSDVVAFSAGPSQHEDCLAEDAFVDNVRGGVLDAERVNQTRQEEVQWRRDIASCRETRRPLCVILHKRRGRVGGELCGLFVVDFTSDRFVLNTLSVGEFGWVDTLVNCEVRCVRTEICKNFHTFCSSRNDVRSTSLPS